MQNNSMSFDEFKLKLPAIFTLDENIKLKLYQYLVLLFKWNKVYSLTAIKTFNEAIDKHIIDALIIKEEFDKIENCEVNILDVGSGMGIPGIVLAILYPKFNIYLSDINQKKCSFLNQVKIDLNLQNMQVILGDVAHISKDICFKIAISRAFSNVDKFLKILESLDISEFWMMKSTYLTYELKDLDSSIKYQIKDITHPTIPAKRYLLKVFK